MKIDSIHCSRFWPSHFAGLIMSVLGDIASNPFGSKSINGPPRVSFAMDLTGFVTPSSILRTSPNCWTESLHYSGKLSWDPNTISISYIPCRFLGFVVYSDRQHPRGKDKALGVAGRGREKGRESPDLPQWQTVA